MIKQCGHLRTLEKCRKHSPAARVFYISSVFSIAPRALIYYSVIHGRSGVNTLYYIHTWKKLPNADWLRQMAFFSWPWGYFWYHEGIITDPDWLKVAPQRSVLSEIHLWMNIGYATQVRTLKVGVNLILNCPQSHGGLYNKMLGVPRGALIDKTSRRVLFGCWWFVCLSLRKVGAIGINGLQMRQRETNSV